MMGFVALVSVLVTVVVMPTTTQFNVVDTQENSITLKAFEKNLEYANLYASSYCNKKGKISQLNSAESKKYRVVSVHDYKYDCIASIEQVSTSNNTDEQESSTAIESEEVQTTVETEKAEEVAEVESTCSSNTYKLQEQDDGSWKTVCVVN